MKQLYKKNWEGTTEKVKGRLEKWKWLIPNMSYRGRTLVINNLIASSLWHKLTCIDPPLHLLAEIQAILVDFFLGQVTLGSTEYIVFTQRRRRTRIGTSSK